MDKVIEFLKNYLTQKTTYLGAIKILIALGLFNITPEFGNQIADTLVLVAEAALGVIGVVLVVKNERKDD